MKSNETDENKKQEEDEKKRARRRFWALIIVILLLLFLFFIFQWKINERNERLAAEQRKQAFELAVEKARKTADSIADAERQADSLENIARDTIVDAKDTIENGELRIENNKRQKLKTQEPDTLGQGINSKEQKDNSQFSILNSQLDTTPPTPSILPPPGRYYKPITLTIECGEPKCETEISVGDSLNAVKGKIENYNKTGKVYFRATDSANNASRWEAAAYDMASDNACAGDSYPVPVKGKTVCVDAYEFPNKAGEKPRNMVSQEAAARLCENAGKRLCTIEEWQAACKGNSNSRYPYGNSYNQTKCVTDLKSAKEPNRSGFAAHCRSYYGMYDMSGNLWEWTSSPAPREGLFLVAGGAWNTQNASGCTETKFSFYPQNEYPFVGFRCCK